MSDRIEYRHLEFCHKPSLIGEASRPQPKDAVDIAQHWSIWRDADNEAVYFVQLRNGAVHEIPASNVRAAIPMATAKAEEKPKPEPIVKAVETKAEAPKSKLPPRRGAAPVADAIDPVTA